MSRKEGLRIAIIAAVGGQTGIVADVASAQSALEEIVVTATRRATDVQDVPLAVTALSAEALVNQNIEDLEDFTSVIPNVLVRGSGGAGTNSATLNMRGLPGVGVYVDGIWQVTGAGLLQRPFLELDRVEVLRGPQGTLYGRDSTGGSIHVHSAPPQEEFGGVVNMALGSFDRRDVTASVDLPITPSFRTKWSMANFKRDGYVTSQVTGVDTGSFEDVVLRGDLLFEPTDRLSMRYIYQQDDIESLTARVTNFIYPEVAWEDGTQVGMAQMHDIASGGRFNRRCCQSGYPGGSLGEFENRQKLTTPTRQDLEQHTFRVDYDLTDNLSVNYLYGDTEVLDSSYIDFGGTEFIFFVDYSVTRTEFDSHEIQFNGDHGRMSWNAGGYFWDQTVRNRNHDYAAAEWVQAPDQGIPKTLDYNDVLASPACQMTAADRGYDFEGVTRSDGSVVGPADGPDSWIFPCDSFFGHGLLDFNAFLNVSGDQGDEEGQDGEAYFGQLTFRITDQWDVTFGARYHEQTNTSVQIDVAGGIEAGITEPAPFVVGDEYASLDRALAGSPVATGPGSLSHPTSTTSFDHTSYRFGTSYNLSDDVMVYLGYNEGFNSGGTSSFRDSNGNLVLNHYDPEVIENTELGVRADLLDGRMRLNATYFDTDWLGIQISAQAIDPVTGSALSATTTQNAASGFAKGLDLELRYSATESLELGTNLGFLDTGYTEVQEGITEPYDLNTTFTGAPDKTYNFYAEHEWALASGASVTARTSYSYTGFYERSSLLSFRQRSIVPDRDPEGGDFWMLDARAVYRPAAGNYEISLYGNNLTNEYNLNSGFMHRFWNFDFGTVDRPREIGLNFQISF